MTEHQVSIIRPFMAVSYFICRLLIHIFKDDNHPLTSVSEGMITVRLSNKEIVITAVKIVITADPQESKFEKIC